MTVQSDFGGDVSLMAAFNQEEEFMGLLASSDAGLFVRAGGAWIPVTNDNRFFIGANVVDIEDDFLDIFDKLDAKGAEPNAKQVLSYQIVSEEEEPSDQS